MNDVAPVKPGNDYEVVRSLMKKHGGTNPVDWPAKDNAAYWKALKRLRIGGARTGTDARTLIKERPELFDSPDSSVPGERDEELERRGLTDEWAERLLTPTRGRKGDFGR